MLRNLLLPVIILFFLLGCFPAKQSRIDLSGLTRESTKIYSEKIDDSTRLIKRENNNLVKISFFEQFNDTVILYENGIEKGRWFIHAKNNPYTSTGYSGIDYILIANKKRNTITLRLLQQKKYIQFELDKNYPWYIIQRYNAMWYIRSSKVTLKLI